MRLYISATIVAVLTFMSSLPDLQAQSLADVARREQERRKSVKSSGKVLTNKDLGGASTPAAPAAANAATPADSAAAKPADVPKKEEPAKDQAYWKGRMNALRTQLDRDQTFAEALQTRVNSLSADFVNRDDPAQRANIERDRQRSIAEQSRLMKSIEDGKKAVADLEEEARRAGVPPGWLR